MSQVFGLMIDIMSGSLAQSGAKNSDDSFTSSAPAIVWERQGAKWVHGEEPLPTMSPELIHGTSDKSQIVNQKLSTFKWQNFIRKF